VAERSGLQQRFAFDDDENIKFAGGKAARFLLVLLETEAYWT
jgi:hypothetical protein